MFLRLLQGLYQGLLGAHLGLSHLFLPPHRIDAVGQSEGQQHHLQRRSDQEGVHRKRVGGQQAVVVHRLCDHAEQKCAPSQQEILCARVASAHTQSPGHQDRDHADNGQTRDDQPRSLVRQNQRTREGGKPQHRLSHDPAVHVRHAGLASQKAAHEPNAKAAACGVGCVDGIAVPPQRIWPQKLCAQTRVGRLRQTDTRHKHHVDQIGRVAHRQEQQQVVQQQTDQQAEVQAENGIGRLILQPQGGRLP